MHGAIAAPCGLRSATLRARPEADERHPPPQLRTWMAVGAPTRGVSGVEAFTETKFYCKVRQVVIYANARPREEVRGQAEVDRHCSSELLCLPAAKPDG